MWSSCMIVFPQATLSSRFLLQGTTEAIVILNPIIWKMYKENGTNYSKAPTGFSVLSEEKL